MDEPDPLAIDWFFYAWAALNIGWTWLNIWGFRESRRLLKMAANYYQDARLTYERAFGLSRGDRSDNDQ